MSSKPQKKSKFTHLLLITLTTTLLPACGSTKTTFDEVGTVNVAAISVTPWHKIVSKLSPNFKITGEQALQQVRAISQASNQKRIDLISARGRAAFSLITPTTPSTQGQNQTSAPPMAVNPGSISANPTENLPDQTISTNPILEYWAATALTQEVAMLNQHINDAAITDGYRPYIVRVQVNQSPRLRGLSYDTYTTLSFFTAAKNKKTGTAGSPIDVICTPSGKNAIKEFPRIVDANPIVIPLIVTDAVETASRSQSVDVIRELALQLMGTGQLFNANFDFDKFNRLIRNTLGQEYNSLMNVSRISENGVQVRLGAKLQVSLDDQKENLHSVAMDTRNHYVSLLVLVPNTLLNLTSKLENTEDRIEPQLYLTAKSRFFNANTGREIKSQPDIHLMAGIYNALYQWFRHELPWLKQLKSVKDRDEDLRIAKSLPILPCLLDLNKYADYRMASELNKTCMDNATKLYFKLATSVLLDDFQGFRNKVIQQGAGNTITHLDDTGRKNDYKEIPRFYEKIRAAWHLASEERAKLRVSLLRIPISYQQTQLPPNNQLIIVNHKNNKLSLSLHRGSWLDATTLKPQIRICKVENGQRSTGFFYPTKVETANNGQTLSLSFAVPDKYKVQTAKLLLEFIGPVFQCASGSTDNKDAKELGFTTLHTKKCRQLIYEKFHNLGAPVAKIPPFTLTITNQFISDNTLTVGVAFPKDKPPAEVYLRITNADATLQAQKGLPVSHVPGYAGVVKFTKTATAKFTLKNHSFVSNLHLMLAPKPDQTDPKGYPFAVIPVVKPIIAIPNLHFRK